ncbi:unnamed protein product [Pleuronectes platessa]|uniref:G-protein coupled receptors family 1 profile domain-containing protein n=1 Tax=Pleuronectes platessa TaxID=8262 RepID=A0A9N7UVK4_PLEPL|nr:unnamed protein product [Pleuronectes platessa]
MSFSSSVEMYDNSSPPDVSLSPHLRPPLNSSHDSSPVSCFLTTPSSTIFTVFTFTNILLLLPLSISVLVFGVQQRRRRRGAVATDPIDVFTFHMVAMELMGMCGSVSCCCGALLQHVRMVGVGCNMFAIISCMKMFFHVLTCVERYLAVVHPITYLRLSKRGGVMIRNISIGCVWLISSGVMTLRFTLTPNFIMILFFCNLSFSLIVASYCSLAVLRVLIGPGPGEGGRKGSADKLKRRAFFTIMVIMAVLLMRFGGNLVCLSLASSSVLGHSLGCAVQVSGIWFCLPSSYVLPLLFLQRARKRSNESR